MCVKPNYSNSRHTLIQAHIHACCMQTSGVNECGKSGSVLGAAFVITSGCGCTQTSSCYLPTPTGIQCMMQLSLDLKAWKEFESEKRLWQKSSQTKACARYLCQMCFVYLYLYTYYESINLQVAIAFVSSTTQWRHGHKTKLPYMFLHLGTGWRCPACTIRTMFS